MKIKSIIWEQFVVLLCMLLLVIEAPGHVDKLCTRWWGKQKAGYIIYISSLSFSLSLSLLVVKILLSFSLCSIFSLFNVYLFHLWRHTTSLLFCLDIYRISRSMAYFRHVKYHGLGHCWMHVFAHIKRLSYHSNPIINIIYSRLIS